MRIVHLFAALMTFGALLLGEWPMRISLPGKTSFGECFSTTRASARHCGIENKGSTMHELLFIIAATTVIYSLISKRIQGSIVTPPMVFTLIGVLTAFVAGDFLNEESSHEVLEFVAELTLVIVLFIDASRIKIPLLIKDYQIPTRLLGVGLPLTVVFGTVAAKLIFPQLSFWEAALLSAVLAPTDAALGQAVVSSPAVPEKIRQSLNVESGLNDGIVLPLVILCASLAGAGEPSDVGGLMIYWAKQVALGPLVGVVVGWFGGRWLERAKKADWLSPSFEKLSGVALALLAWSGALLIDGNGFMAAFVAGMAISCHSDCIGDAMRDFGEAEAQWLTLVTFLLFGATSVLPVLENFEVMFVVYAILSLTVIRMVPVAISLVGLGFHRPTFWFVGWFGPRGLATLLFALTVVSKFEVLHGQLIFNVASVTVVLSTVLHGLSAVPGTKAYSKALKRTCNDQSLERQLASAFPLKFRMFDD